MLENGLPPYLTPYKLLSMEYEVCEYKSFWTSILFDFQIVLNHPSYVLTESHHLGEITNFLTLPITMYLHVCIFLDNFLSWLTYCPFSAYHLTTARFYMSLHTSKRVKLLMSSQDNPQHKSSLHSRTV
jgi:hypothetical protein